MNPNPLSIPACDPAGHCITCSDEGIPMQVVADLGDGLAICADARGREQEVMTGLIDTIAPGDTLLVHAGTALIRVPAAEGSTA